MPCSGLEDGLAPPVSAFDDATRLIGESCEESTVCVRKLDLSPNGLTGEISIGSTQLILFAILSVCDDLGAAPFSSRALYAHAQTSLIRVRDTIHCAIRVRVCGHEPHPFFLSYSETWIMAASPVESPPPEVDSSEVDNLSPIRRVTSNESRGSNSLSPTLSEFERDAKSTFWETNEYGVESAINLQSADQEKRIYTQVC